ncbi:MAG: hypothetical protein ACYC9H_13160 [Sulfuricaulis sp.]
MDYRITDEFADPIGLTDNYYTEKLIRLPGSFSCFQPPRDRPMSLTCPFNGMDTLRLVPSITQPKLRWK